LSLKGTPIKELMKIFEVTSKGSSGFAVEDV
jgi:hypothetical protein